MTLVKYSSTLLLRWITAFGFMAVQSMAGETATAVATVTAGFVTGITVTSGGSGYTSEPAVTISGGGGSGATAKAVLNGDRVAVVIVLTAGSGYMSEPSVIVEASPKALNLRLRLVPEITVEGPAGSLARVESAGSLAGPWTTWTNLTVSVKGEVLVDLSPGVATRFYRSVVVQSPAGPAGFVWISPGTFTMGSPDTEPDRRSDEKQHTVTLTHGFWMSDHEVTQAEYEAVMGSNPSLFKGDANQPVEQVSWNNAVSYCEKLTKREREAGRITAQQAYRLPTEAEWEYAARAGTTEARHGETDLIAWYQINSGGQTKPVKGKQPNAWGLYDMIGNVWEWCSDWYGEYAFGITTDPVGPISGLERVGRGAGWDEWAWSCRSAFRQNYHPDFNYDALGFRSVLSEVR